MLHLDNAATSPVREEALAAAWPYLTASFGNPSSTHGLGEQAAAALADARKSVAAALGVLQTWLTSTVGNRVTGDLRVRLFEHLQAMGQTRSHREELPF